MGTEVLRLTDLHAGDEKTLRIATTDDAGAPKTVVVGTTFLVYDPDRITQGTVDSGTPTTIVDDARTEAADLWNGIPLELTRAADGQVYLTEVADWDVATHTLTFHALPITPAAGDTYKLRGYPVYPRAAATLAANQGSVQLTPADATGQPGRRVLVYHADFGTDSEEVVGTFRVREAAP